MAPETDTDAAGAESDAEEPMDREVFEDAMTAFDAALDAIETLQAEVATMDTPLSQADTVALLFGRRNSLNKTDIKTAFDTLDDVDGVSRKTLLRRVLADMSDLNQSEAEAFIDELDRLQRRYGDGSR